MAVDNGAASANAVVTFPPLANFGVETHLGHTNFPDVATLDPQGPQDAPFLDPNLGTTLITQTNKTNLVTGVGIRFCNPA